VQGLGRPDSATWSGAAGRQALGLGCAISHARELVAADGLDLDAAGAITPVGVSCRVCSRVDCPDRAAPAQAARFNLDETRRGWSIYGES
jgi:predicted transcriptional regulator